MKAMWRMIILTVSMMWSAAVLNAQSQDEWKVISALVGEEVENMNEHEVERLQALLVRPVRINTATLTRLVDSGLFTRYQAASLIDYRNRSGAVMSYMELATIDGFGQEFTDRIRPFLCLDMPASGAGESVRSEALLRTTFKTKDGKLRYSYDSRYNVEVGERIGVAIGISRSLDARRARPDIMSGHIEWRSGRLPLKLIAGDFNARFGQGLALWNGLSISSLNSPSAFMKRSSGLTSSSSLTGKYAFTGLAGEVEIRRLILSFMLAAPGLKQVTSKPDRVGLIPAANLTYICRNGQLGMTHYTEFSGLMAGMSIPAMKTSFDGAFCIKGADVFGEVSYDWVDRSPSVRTGTVFPIGEPVDAAVMMRSSRKEHALTVSGSLLTGRWMQVNSNAVRRIDGTFSTDIILYPEPKSQTQDRSLQVKMHSQWQIVLTESFLMVLRVTERMRSWGQIFKTDLRVDLDWNSQRFSTSVRMNVLNCVETGFLTYAEGGFKTEKTALYLRQGLFVIDNWDDRIYAYERDVPGSFNVPALYGRGLWTSFMASWKPARWIKLYARLGYTSYIFMKKEKKPGRAELRFQCMFDF